MINDLVLKNRSYRRFDGEIRMTDKQLEELIELVRLTPSTVNSQALKFCLINDDENCEKVFATLSWAGLLKNWKGPSENERPTSYIIILCDLALGRNKFFDDGIAAQTIMLGAVEKGYGGCILGAIDKDRLANSLNINTEKYSIDLVLALGKPKETVKIVDVGADGSTAYFRDENGTHFVPKRSAKELIYKAED